MKTYRRKNRALPPFGSSSVDRYCPEYGSLVAGLPNLAIGCCHICLHCTRISIDALFDRRSHRATAENATVRYPEAFELLDRKTTNTAAYPAAAAMVCSFEALERSDTSKEKITIQTEIVIKWVRLLD